MSKIILPTYTTTQPSTGKTIKYRPFTVKEEKALLLALQDGNPANISEAIKTVVSVCTSEAIDVNTTPYYDIEYIFLQIRSKSVGEIIDLVGSCECDPEARTKFSVDIETVKIEPKPVGTIAIKIPDTNYTIQFRHPSIDDFIKTSEVSGENATEIVSNCIVGVFTDDEVMDWSYEEKLEFVESMTTKQQKDIAQFLRDMPMVKLPAQYKCIKCGKDHSQDISGFANFFV